MNTETLNKANELTKRISEAKQFIEKYQLFNSPETFSKEIKIDITFTQRGISSRTTQTEGNLLREWLKDELTNLNERFVSRYEKEIAKLQKEFDNL